MIRQFDTDSMRRIGTMVRDWERYSRPLINLITARSASYRPVNLKRNAIVTTSITARSGLVKGQGKVSIYCADPANPATDKVIETDVMVYNPYRTAIATNSAGRIVQIEVIDGLLQVTGADCP